MSRKALATLVLLAAHVPFAFAQQPEQNDKTQQFMTMMMMMIMSSAQSSADKTLQEVSEALQKLMAALPPEEQRQLDAVSADLVKRPDEVIYRLSWSTDICASKLLDCHGLTNDKVKPVIVGMLEYKKKMEAVAQERRSLWISLGGLGISFCSLAMSILAVFRKGRASNTKEAEAGT